MRLERGQQEEQKEEEERSGEDVVPGDSVSNQGEGVAEEGTDDAKLKRLSTAERKVKIYSKLFQMKLNPRYPGE